MEVYFDNIKIFRKKMGLNINEFCEKINVGRTTYWRWVKGISLPSIVDLQLMARVLQVNVVEIANVTNENNISTEILTTDIWQDVASDYSRIFDDKVKKIIQEIKGLSNSFNSMVTLMSGILESSDIAFYAKDVNLKYVIVNKAFLKNLSLNKNYNVYGKSDNDLFNKKEALLNAKQDESVFYYKKSIINKEQYILGTRKKRWGLTSKTIIFDTSGKKLGIIGLTIDITENKRNEKIHEMLATVFSKTSYNVLFRNLAEKTSYFVTDNHLEVFGRELTTDFSLDLRTRIKRCVYEKDIETVYTALDKFYNTGMKEVNLEFREYGEHTGFKIRWIQLYLCKSNFLNNTCYVRLGRDITCEKEEQIKYKQTYYLVNNLEKSATFLTETPEKNNGAFKYIFVSENVEKITGYSADYFFNTQFPITKLLDKGSQDILKRVNSGGNSSRYELIVNRKDGKKIWCELVINFFRNEGLLYSSVVLTDITENKMLAKELLAYKNAEFEQQEKNKIKKIAVKLKNNGIDCKIIADSTGISIEEVEKI